MNYIQSNFILGEAGTAKTTTIINTISNIDDFICLAYTHSAVNNLRSKYIRQTNHNNDFINNFCQFIILSFSSHPKLYNYVYNIFSKFWCRRHQVLETCFISFEIVALSFYGV